MESSQSKAILASEEPDVHEMVQVAFAEKRQELFKENCQCDDFRCSMCSVKEKAMMSYTMIGEHKKDARENHDGYIAAMTALIENAGQLFDKIKKQFR